MAALRVDVAGLRPWEWDAMAADRYDRIVHLQGVWRRESKAAREAVERTEARKAAKAKR